MIVFTGRILTGVSEKHRDRRLRVWLKHRLMHPLFWRIYASTREFHRDRFSTHVIYLRGVFPLRGWYYSFIGEYHRDGSTAHISLFWSVSAGRYFSFFCQFYALRVGHIVNTPIKKTIRIENFTNLFELSVFYLLCLVNRRLSIIFVFTNLIFHFWKLA